MLALVTVLDALNTATKQLDRSVAHLEEHPDAEVFTSLPRSGQINAAQVLAEWATLGQPTTRPTRSPPWPASPRSPKSPENNTPCTSAGRATNASAEPPPHSLTTVDISAPGPHTSTTKPAPAATTIPMPSASSPAPGSA
ncbi:putative transposase [Mycobacterium xenopi 4042]|uniref:Putative transposase n=1 Tax=Mycobacterium xenopi 4042 TaxID=1299334 RepID=X8AI09_MYCXE|nr:putative transposase [Mycobacterium xenopi 4042]